MKLNLAVLKEDLSEWELKGDLTEEPYVMKCTYAILCTVFPEHFDDTILYVAETDILPDRPPRQKGCPSILCAGKPPEAWLSENCNLLYTEQTGVSPMLLNAVNRCFYFYGQWERKLQEVLDQNMPLTEMAYSSVEVFHNGNGMYAQGSSYNVIFAVVPEVNQPTSLYMNYKKDFTLKAGTVLPPEDINILITDQEYNLAVNATVPTIYSGIKYGFRTLFYNIFTDKACIARLCFDEIYTPFTGRDFALIQVLGDYLGKGLTARGAYTFSRPANLDDILEKLLSCQFIPEEKILSVIRCFNWQINDQYICLVLRLKSGDDTLSALGSIASGLASLSQNDCYTIFDNSIVFISNLSKNGQSRSSFLEALLPVLRDNLLEAGISTVYHDFRQLYYFYHQAETARILGSKKDPMYWYFRYEDYQVEHILSQCIRKTIPETLIPDGLKALIAYDKKKGSDYVNLLRIYLETERNIAETIRVSYMHRNTFLYRIQKIEKILEMDLNDARVRLVLELAFLLMDSEGSSSGRLPQ